MKQGARIATCGLLLGLLLSIPAHAARVVAVEIVDLSCPHCAAFAPAADALASKVRDAGGIWRVAPVGPVIGGNSPSQSVLSVYWSEIHQSDRQAQAVADALYDGYQANAALDGPAGISSWLATHGIDWPSSRRLFTGTLTQHFLRAVRLAGTAGVRKLPAVIFVNPKDGSVTHTLSWRGSVSDLRNRVMQRIDPIEGTP